MVKKIIIPQSSDYEHMTRHPVKSRLHNIKGRDPITALYETMKKKTSHREVDLSEHHRIMEEIAEREARKQGIIVEDPQSEPKKVRLHVPKRVKTIKGKISKK